MRAFKFLMILFAFVIALSALTMIVIVVNKDFDVMGFEPKEELAKKINGKLGGMSTRDLRYDKFIELYPEGDNALYIDIKRLDVIDMPGLMSIL